MIEGFAILSETVKVDPSFPLLFFSIFAGMILFIYGCVEERGHFVLAGILIFVSCMVSAIVWNPSIKTRTVEALVSSSAPYVEIANRYELIEQRGKVYVFRDKEYRWEKQDNSCKHCGK